MQFFRKLKAKSFFIAALFGVTNTLIFSEIGKTEQTTIVDKIEKTSFLTKAKRHWPLITVSSLGLGLAIALPLIYYNVSEVYYKVNCFFDKDLKLKPMPNRRELVVYSREFSECTTKMQEGPMWCWLAAFHGQLLIRKIEKYSQDRLYELIFDKKPPKNYQARIQHFYYAIKKFNGIEGFTRKINSLNLIPDFNIEIKSDSCKELTFEVAMERMQKTALVIFENFGPFTVLSPAENDGEYYPHAVNIVSIADEPDEKRNEDDKKVKEISKFVYYEDPAIGVKYRVLLYDYCFGLLAASGEEDIHFMYFEKN
ncbi:hypothetical protein FACS189465_2130 [Clostridia bacterium]|nr:hypothetical protein FACS189465_2130 [Clostridia bacterium]